MKDLWIYVAVLAALMPCLSLAEVIVQAQRKPGRKWEEYPTRRLEDLKGFKPAAIPLTKFGGRAHRREKATGFFRVQRVGDRWWLVDPEGALFIHVGVVGVSPKSRYGSAEAFTRLFGDKERWADLTLRSLREYGFNGIGGFSDAATVSKAPQPLAYTVTLSLLSSFGKKLGITHQLPGHTGYLNDCMPVFHPDFPAFCDAMCGERVAPMKDDPWLVGYFSDNEMPAPVKMLDNMLALDETNAALAPLRQAAQQWLRERKRSGVPTDADREAFLGFVYETYFRITTEAIRRHDPNHLCLGSRFHNPVREKQAVWAAAGGYCDAISMNYYGTWTPRPTDLANWTQWSGKPCLITEFYTKGEDSKMPNTTGAGWVVKTQADRGLFYQNYTLALLESKTCVGWHWFKYMDNDPEDTGADPSNRDSNKGIFNIRYEPYMPLLERMKPIGQNVYALTDYFDAKRR